MGSAFERIIVSVVCLTMIFNNYSHLWYYHWSLVVLPQNKDPRDFFSFHSAWNHIWTTQLYQKFLFYFPLQVAGLLQATIIPCDLSNVDKISVWNYVEQLGSLLWSTIVNDIDISHPSQSGAACVGHDTSAALEVVFALCARLQSFLRRPFILPRSSRFLLKRNECIAYRWFFNPMIFLVCF
jgi:hypothetical protein